MDFPFGRPQAIANIHGADPAAGPIGTVAFYCRPTGTLVAANICRLPQSGPEIFGFHIHEGCSCGGTGFSKTGGHYSKGNCDHPRHAGDLPPLFGCGGHARMAVLTGRFRVADVIGRTVVIHSQPDDFTSQPAGNAGKKIACGVIHPLRR